MLAAIGAGFACGALTAGLASAACVVGVNAASAAWSVRRYRRQNRHRSLGGYVSVAYGGWSYSGAPFFGYGAGAVVRGGVRWYLKKRSHEREFKRIEKNVRRWRR